MSQSDQTHQDETAERITAAATTAEQLTRDIDDAVRREQAENQVKSHVLAAATVALVPVSLFDMVGLVATQVAMVRTLARIYQVPFDEIRAKALVISLLAGSAPALSVVALSSGAKLIPGIGTLLGSGSVAVAGGATTYAVGRVLMHHFERGGTLLDVDLAKLRRGFKREIRRGWGIVRGGGPQSPSKRARGGLADAVK